MKRFINKRLSLVWLLSLMTVMVWAQIPSGYYDAAEGKTGQDLRQALHNIIKGHKVVSYSGLLTAYGHTDVDENGNIIDIYSTYHFDINGNCGSYKKEGDCWNREHTWPQSWFGDGGTPKSDLFHVYPTDGYVNGRRSNYPYAEVKDVKYKSTNGSKLGTSKTEGYSGTAFEPADEYKGDIARTYFYMSTRYYLEDGKWSTSAMTNKCEIEPWAIKMLLRWNDQDPVSQKEIDRNNAIYNIYQNNRNPFIDHPEYAHMIWDENWTEGTYYDITCATGLENGSVSAPARAAKGSTVTITAKPDEGYKTETLSACKTGSPATTISVSSNGTFTMPDYAVTVSGTFVKDNTQYLIELAHTTHGTIRASAEKALSGTTVTLTATPDEGYALHAWYVYKTGNETVKTTVENNQFTMPSYNVTVAATFAKESAEVGNGDFVKVTTKPDDWSGIYLIVNEENSVAFNGELEKDWGRCSSVTISSGEIASDETVNAYSVTVSKTSNGYTFLLPSGKYMNWTGEKAFSEGDEAVAYQLSLTDGNVSIAYGNYELRYNYNQGSGGLRSYKTTSTISRIQLYKKTVVQEPVNFTVTFHNGSDSYSQTVKENVATALTPCTFTRRGYLFYGWNTDVDGEGDYFADRATVTLLDDLDLYALWDKLYSVTLQQEGDGTVDITPAEATEGTVITVTATPAEGFKLGSITVTDDSGSSFELEDDEFEMPAADVTVTVVFASPSTVIDDLNRTTATNNSLFDLQGRRVVQPTKGVYVIGGKKVVR